jgi:hypothetical protein
MRSCCYRCCYTTEEGETGKKGGEAGDGARGRGDGGRHALGEDVSREEIKKGNVKCDWDGAD